MRTLFTLLLFIASFSSSAQVRFTASFADDLAKLIDINKARNGLIDFSGKEAVSLEDADANQIVEITSPYLHSTVVNGREICIHLLGETLFKKPVTPSQKNQLLNIICKNFLDGDCIHTASVILLQYNRKDFSPEAVDCIAKLSDSLSVIAEIDNCAQLLSLVQVKKSIPALWKVANKNIATIGQTDIAILASLARMDETEAAVLLCNRYNYIKSNADRQVYIAKFLAFSLHPTVLKCLVKDYKLIDINKHYRDGDELINPGLTLAAAIVSMLNNYPYEKNEFKVDPKQLLSWLNTTKQYELIEK